MSNWWYATSVDVTNGSDLVRVNTGDDAKYFERGSCWLKIAGHEAVETDGLITDGADTFIRLTHDWFGETDTGRRAFAFRTVPDFQGVADKLAANIEASQEVVDNVISKMGTVLTSTDESVVIETPEGDVEVVPYGRLKADIEQQFNEFVDARQQQIDEATSKVDAANLEREFDDQCTLILDFARNRYEVYEGISSGNKERSTFADLVSFTRGSEKTGFDALGRLRTAGIDVPVFPWEGGEPQGLGVHRQSTNLIIDSESPFIDTGSNGTATKNQVGLFGETDTAWLIEGNYTAADTPDNLRILATGLPSNFYSPSMFFKSVDGGPVTIVFRSSGESFRLSQEISGSGWHRLTPEIVEEVTNSRTIIHSLGGRPFIAYGYQLEEGRSVTPYIKTSGTELTRLADDCRIDDLQNQPWWNPNEGAFFIDVKINEITRQPGGVLFTVGSSNSGRIMVQIASGIAIIVQGNNEIPAEVFRPAGTSVYPTSGRLFIAISYANGNVLVSINGSKTLGTEHDHPELFVRSNVMIGVLKRAWANDHTDGVVRSIKYSPVALPPEKLQTLSAGTDND